MNANKRLWFLVWLVLVAWVPAGCGSGGGGAANDPLLLGAVEGYAFIPDSGPMAVTLGRSAAPPAGMKPLKGASVEIAGSAVAASTGNDGHFLLKDVRPGLRKLRITPPGGAAADFPLTVLGGAAITVGEPKVSRQQAIDSVKQAVTLIAAPDSVNILAPQQPLPAGVTVAPALGNDSGQDDPALTYRVPAPRWFVYVDFHPDARFQHRVLYYFVDIETGQIASREASSWPLINNLMYYGRVDINETSPDLAQAARRVARATVPGRQATSEAPDSRDHVPSCASAKTHFFIVQGHQDPDIINDSIGIQAVLKDGLSGSTLERYTPPETERIDGLQAVRRQFEAICQRASECETLFISIHSHGNRDGSFDLMQGLHRDGEGSGQSKARAFPYQILPLERCRACHIVVIFDFCFSGKALEDMKQYIESRPEGFRGKKVLLLAAARPNEYAIRRDKGNPPRNGWLTFETLPEYRSLIKSLPAPVTALTTEQVIQAFDRARPRIEQNTANDTTDDAVTPPLKGQHPVSWMRSLEPGEHCNPGGTATRWAVDLKADLKIGSEVVFKKGEKIPLSWIKGYMVSEAHLPVTPESGCESRHLHAMGESGVTIQRPGQSARGPFADPDHRHCGYGHVVDVPF
ncbi:MAG: carboxypeptidase regulatory-like domain-containing protein [Armatimonadetes bacterium]|nr:carboxypeptidase regulatory-like domain-containing protein [Armatimonadota bacterium]